MASTPPGEIEKRRAREKRREALHKDLPLALQLKHPIDRPGKDRWDFDGELWDRRKSDRPEDKLFFIRMRNSSPILTSNRDGEGTQLVQLGREVASEGEDFIFMLSFLSKCFSGKSDPHPVVRGEYERVFFLQETRDEKDYHTHWQRFRDSIRKEWGEETIMERGLYNRELMEPMAEKNPTEFAALTVDRIKNLRSTGENSFDSGEENSIGSMLEALPVLAKKDPSACHGVIECALSSPSMRLHWLAYNHIHPLATIDPDRYKEIILTGIKEGFKSLGDDKSEIPIVGVYQGCGSLAQIDKGEFLKIYELGVKANDQTVQLVSSQSLEYLAEVDPNEYLKRYEEGLQGSAAVLSGTLSSLRGLARADPAAYEKKYLEALKSIKIPVWFKQRFIDTLDTLGEKDSKRYEKLIDATIAYSESVGEERDGILAGVYRSIGPLANSNPKRCEALLFDVLNSPGSIIRNNAIASLSDVAAANPQLGLKLLSDFKPEEEFEEGLVAESLIVLSKNIDIINPVNQIDEYVGGLEEREKTYTIQQLLNLLRLEKNPGWLRTRYLPKQKSLVRKLVEINESLPEDKKTDDVSKFLDSHGREIAILHALDPRQINAFFEDTAKSHGFKRVESFLKLNRAISIRGLKASQKILEKSGSTRSPHEVAKLAIYASTATSTNLEEVIEGVSSEADPDSNLRDLNNAIGQKFMEFYGKRLGLKPENIKPGAINEWNLPYLAHLFHADRSYPEEVRSLLRLKVKMTLQEEDFTTAITENVSGQYNEEEREQIKAIHLHNRAVRDEFEELGIDYDKWLRYGGELEFSVGLTKQDREDAVKLHSQQTHEVVTRFLGSRSEGKQGLLEGRPAMRLYKKVFGIRNVQPTKDGLIRGGKSLSLDESETIMSEFQNELKKLYDLRGESLGSDERVALEHLRGVVSGYQEIRQIEENKGCNMRICLSRRQPGFDLFQGNYTQNCTALGSDDRGAVLDYLFGTENQMIEITDLDRGEVGVNSLIYFGMGRKGSLDLVQDNVEIRSTHKPFNRIIREKIASFAKGLCEAVAPGRVKNVTLGRAYEDVYVLDLPSVSKAEFKVGGSLRGQMYADAYGGNWIDATTIQRSSQHVLTGVNEEPKIVLPKAKVNWREVSEVSTEKLEEIRVVETRCFPEGLRDFTAGREGFDDEGGFLLLLEDEKTDKVVGYLYASPGDTVGELPEEDQRADLLYIHSIAVKPTFRGTKHWKDLFDRLKRSQNAGYNSVGAHVRVNTGLSPFLQKAGFTQLGRNDDHEGSGEPFDYLKINLNK